MPRVTPTMQTFDPLSAGTQRTSASASTSITATEWVLRVLAACALAAALGGCDKAPQVPTFDPPPPGAPVPKTGASHAGTGG